MIRFRNRMLVAAVAATLFAASTFATAGELSATVSAVRDRWAEVNYNTPKKQREAAFDALAKQAAAARAAQPKDANAMIWEGIVLSSFAGERGGLGALGLAKDAKQRLDEALKINDKALSGSAYTSLATLYAKVPGWPIGFGDKARAEEYFKKSLAINPDGIDPNFFYGEYLYDRDRFQEARSYLEKALKAPPRPGRELADSGRRQEIRALLAKLDKEAR